MPTRERLDTFIKTVESGDHVRAIKDFYHENATMQENGHEPRLGRDVLMKHEQNALDQLSEMKTYPAREVFLNGDNVAIHWTFEMTAPNGKTRTIDEVALQLWQGDRILKERFFYDTASTLWK